MNMINYAIKTTKEKMIKSTVTLSTTPTNISPLTGDDSTDTSTHVSSNSDEASANDTSTNITKSTTTADEHHCGGRPKGTTDAAAKILEEQVEAATQEAAETLKKSKSKSRSSKKRLQRGLLDEILSAARKKHCIPEDVIIHKDTIRQRVKRNTKDGHIGQRSPMLDIEPYLVELVTKLAEMRTPITTTQGLELANSLISGTSTIDKLVAWRDNCAAFCKNGMMKLGKSYWTAFMRRRSHLKMIWLQRK